MTLDEFCTALAAGKDRLTWTVEETGLIRGADPYASWPTFSPLTAVVFKFHGERLSLGRIRKATKRLGLDSLDTHRIIAAADSPVRDNNPEAAALRARLLQCLGLEETL